MMMEEEEEEEEEPAEPEEEETDIHILVLSPRCWAVSSPCYLDDPAAHLPPALCSYLTQFSTFYTHSKLHPPPTPTLSSTHLLHPH